MYHKIFTEMGCDFLMDWHTEQLYLKVIHLYTILVKSTTEGGRILCESVQ